MSKERSSGHKGPWTRHTPGPWTIGNFVGDDGTVYNPSTITSKDADKAICSVYGLPLHTTLDKLPNDAETQTGLANARLIADAPSLLTQRDALLAACNAALSLINDDGNQGGKAWTTATLRDAIALCK